MKNSILLIVGIVAVVTVMIPLNYNALTDHYMYTKPIKNSHVYHEYKHVDSFTLAGNSDTNSNGGFDITLIDAQTVKIGFRNHGNVPWPINDFEDFEREFSTGDSFVAGCEEEKENSSTFLTIFQFNGTRQVEQDLVVDFIHGDASSKTFIPCNYPQIVDYSTNVFDLRYR